MKTQVVYRAFRALGISRCANIAAVQDKPVMGGGVGMVRNVLNIVEVLVAHLANAPQQASHDDECYQC